MALNITSSKTDGRLLLMYYEPHAYYAIYNYTILQDITLTWKVKPFDVHDILLFQ